MTINIHTTSSDDLVTKLYDHNADEAVDVLSMVWASLVHADPNWEYSNSQNNGAAAKQYETQPDMAAICKTLARSVDVAEEDAYLAVWCTMPHLIGFAIKFARANVEHDVDTGRSWSYVTGGMWDKSIDRKLGIGFHFRGQVEPLLLYRVGNPKPLTVGENSWRAARNEHSEKPQLALETLCRMIRPNSLVLDLYAGETASMARACHRTGRHYEGAELDPERAARARNRLKQGDLFHGFAEANA